MTAPRPLVDGPGARAQAALREERWRQVEATWGFLAGAAVERLTGTALDTLRTRDGLIGLIRGGVEVFPGFLFVGEPGAAVVPAAWRALRDLVAPAKWADADTIAWTAAPNPWLEGGTPAEEIQTEPAAPSAALTVAARESLPGKGDVWF